MYINEKKYIKYKTKFLEKKIEEMNGGWLSYRKSPVTQAEQYLQKKKIE